MPNLTHPQRHPKPTLPNPTQSDPTQHATAARPLFHFASPHPTPATPLRLRFVLRPSPRSAPDVGRRRLRGWPADHSQEALEKKQPLRLRRQSRRSKTRGRRPKRGQMAARPPTAKRAAERRKSRSSKSSLTAMRKPQRAKPPRNQRRMRKLCPANRRRFPNASGAWWLQILHVLAARRAARLATSRSSVPRACIGKLTCAASWDRGLSRSSTT